MKKLILFLLVTINCLAQTGTPKLTIEKTDIDLGEIKEGGVVNYELKVWNRGSDTLRINDIKTSCSCISASGEIKPIPAGGSGNINVVFNSADRHGSQKKYVYLFSNDKENPELRVSFAANVVAEQKNISVSKARLVLSDYTFDFGNITEGDTARVNISYKNEGSDPLEIQKVQSSCGCTMAVPSGMIIKPGERGNLKIAFDSSNRFGKTSKTITLFTNDGQDPVQTITLYSNIIKRK